jgi:NADH dehydrogenase
MDSRHRVVIVGGGFGGLYAARSLKHAPVQVTLIDRRNFHLFQPLLYQVATGGLSPANIAAPLRGILRRQANCEVLLAEAVDFDPARRRVILSDDELSYDSLIVAAGSRPSYFGHDQWEHVAPGLKDIEDATEIRRRILLAYEAAEREPDPAARQALMTFIVVGGGPTGVELAGTMAEIAHFTLRQNFRHINPRDAKIMVVDAGERIMSAYPTSLSDSATRSLAQLGVKVRTRAKVTDVLPDRLELLTDDGPETVRAHTVIWAAGVQASPLSRTLAAATGAETDRAGRLMVESDFTVPGHPNVFVIGDMAHYAHDGDRPLPGVAPVAIQEGQYVARVIANRLADHATEPFRYKDYGNMATIGRSKAIAHIGRLKLTGFVAWLLWLFVHLMALVQFENRLLVFLQWWWNYATFNRTARLITGEVLPLRRGDRALEPEPATETTSIGENPEELEQVSEGNGQHAPRGEAVSKAKTP